MSIDRNYVDLKKFDALIERALARTYSAQDRFDNESDFKFELYHHLHQLKLNDHRLGNRMPGHPTCPLHVEAKAENGNPSKADLLVCNPVSRRPFNYAAELVIELKETLDSKALSTEVAKFTRYTGRGIRRLYLIPGNRTTLTESQKSTILSAYPRVARKLSILDRSMIQAKPLSPNPPKRVSIAAGAWVRDVSKWRCGYDVSAWVVLKVRGRDFGRQWRPTVAIWGEFDESAGNSGHPRSGPERSYGQDRLWCVRWSVVDTAVRPAEEWLAVWSVRDRTVFPRASAAGDAK